MHPDHGKPGDQLIVALQFTLGWPRSATIRSPGVEARLYSPAPVGMNFAIVAFADSRGGLAFDDASPAG